MVYCGKPSKGCHHCRRRKIKCDQADPACGQCVRANQTCPGYRDQLDLLFRDETQKVTRKARSAPKPTDADQLQLAIRNRTTKGRKSENPGKSRTVTLSKAAGEYHRLPYSGPSAPLSIDFKHQSLCYFIASFSPPLRTIGMHHLGYLAPAQALMDNETLSVCMAAVGMASLSNISKSRSMWLAAKEQYTKALALVNERLQSVEQAKSNVTLDAVMLLGMYEVITCRGGMSLYMWRNHMDGANALLRLREGSRPTDSENFRTFVQVRGQILSGCLVSETYANLPLLGGDRSTLNEHELVIEEVTSILVDVANLRAAVKEGVISTHSEVIQRALGIRDRFIEFESVLLLKHAPERVINETENSTFLPPEFAYRGKFDLYPDFFSASIWNGYRAGRMTLTGTILTHYRQLQASSSKDSLIWPELEEIVKQEEEDMHTITEDVCRTFAFALGMVRRVRDSISADPVDGSGLGGYLLLWPMYLAAEVAKTRRETQEWVLHRLEYIGNKLGINQALWMADLVRSQLPIDEMLVSTESEIVGLEEI